MANDKFYGYTPKTSKPSGKEGSSWSGEEKGNSYKNLGNRLDRLNPYEFRKGMDYELTSVGVSRLAESTPEEREKATEAVLNNLEEHGGYYTALITYETEYRNAEKKPAFKTWLSEQDEFKMKEVDKSFKNDKMVELKEAIKSQIRTTLLTEAKDDDGVDSFWAAIEKRAEKQKKLKFEPETMRDFEKSGREFKGIDDDEVAKKAAKGARKAAKGTARFDKEIKAIEELLFGKDKGDEKASEENPGKGSLLFIKDKNLEAYKSDKNIDKYKKSIELTDAITKKLEKHVEVFSKLGNKVTVAGVKGKDLPDTIKKLEARITAIKKEEEQAIVDKGKEKNEIASTDMTRANHLRLLEIIKENGISLREGKDSVKVYYEIAKQAYLEGLSKGLKL